MWYVNYDDRLTNGKKGVCFILTIWYVNMQIDTKLMADNSPFYINYVVCKYRDREQDRNNLTQFYINYVVCKCTR